MATRLRQGTTRSVSIGPYLDDTDGVTAETALTITQPDIRLSKDDGAFAQKSAAQTLSHKENGWYSCSLSTTDSNTLGRLVLVSKVAGAMQVYHEFEVVSAEFFDGPYTGKLFTFVASGVEHYVMSWFHNGAPVPVAAVSSPTIQVVKVADAADLIASTAMTEIGTTERFRFDATGAQLMTPGVAYLAIASATIGGATRTWDQPVGRDTTP